MEQSHPSGRDVLKLVHQHVPKLRLPSALAYMLCGQFDEVMEVQHILAHMSLLVVGAHLIEDVKEALVAPSVSGLTGAGAQSIRGQAARS